MSLPSSLIHAVCHTSNKPQQQLQQTHQPSQPDPWTWSQSLPQLWSDCSTPAPPVAAPPPGPWWRPSSLYLGGLSAATLGLHAEWQSVISIYLQMHSRREWRKLWKCNEPGSVGNHVDNNLCYAPKLPKILHWKTYIWINNKIFKQLIFDI